MDKATKIKQLHDEVNEKVVIKFTSSRGHDEVELSPFDALTRIKDETSNRHKWIYLDAVITNPNGLTVEDVRSADDIILMPAQAGGIC